MASSEPQNPPSFALPPYPQMIMEAIETLNDKNGSNKTTISKQIESTQPTLLPSHSTLLSFHLNQMKQNGELVLVKNNYMKPDPQAPPKRGRGRPPKQKSPSEAAEIAVPAVVSADPPRSRGRPPKVRDPSEPVSEVKPAGSGRPRGRPPKKPRTESESESETVSVSAETEPVVGERRGRGRPPKVKTTVVAPVGC